MLLAGIIAFSATRLTGATVKSGTPKVVQPVTGKDSKHIVGLADNQKIAPEVRKVAGDFILTAVARKNIAASWSLVHPDMKGGLTFQEWKSGDIPVVPYPVDSLDHARFSVVERFNDAMLLEVVLIPAKGVTQPARTFQLGLRTMGTGGDRHWTVDYWMPRWTPPIPANPSG